MSVSVATNHFIKSMLHRAMSGLCSLALCHLVYSYNAVRIR